MTPCTTCLTVDCIDVGDLTRYNFQLNAFISPQYTFVVSCPIGVVCQPGVYPVTITIPPGTFIIPLPDPNGPITGVGPLTVQTCTGQLTAAIPDGSTQAQIQALAAGLAQQAAQAQAGCNVLKSPGGSIPAPTPPVFSNNLQCVPTLTCTPPDMFTVTGSIPTGYQLAIDNALCILPGMVTSTSQADADAKALAQVTATAAALIGNGTLTCAENACISTNSPLPSGAVGTLYETILVPIPVLDPGDVWTLTVVGGTIPPGLSATVDAGNPVIFGTPTTPGTYCFTVQLNETPGGGGGGGS